MVKYTEAMVGSEISSENFQNFVNSNLYGTSYTVITRAKKMKNRFHVCAPGDFYPIPLGMILPRSIFSDRQFILF